MNTTKPYTILTMLVLMFSTTVFASEIDVQRAVAIEKMLAMDVDCTFGDGYQCAPRSETDLKINQQGMVPGVYLNAWSVAYLDFLGSKDLDDGQKDLKHYKIGFAENEKHYIVMLIGLLLPSPKGGEMDFSTLTFGKSIRYVIDKTSMQLVSREFYR